MLLPIGDSPNPHTRPTVTWLLIGVNVAVFLLVTLPLSSTSPDLNDPLLLEFLRSHGVQGNVSARSVVEQISAYDLTVFRYGFRPAEPSPVSLVTAMFLHAGWMHLLGNMLFLWIFGDNVEHRLGSIRFLLAYLATGAAATFFFALFVPGSQVPMIGASGAISGVLGLYFIWFPRNQVKVFIFFVFIFQVIQVPARIVLGFYLIVDNLLPFMINGGGSGSGVAHGAHIGGFVAGLGLAWGLDRWPALKAERGWRRGRLSANRSERPGRAEKVSASSTRIATLLRQGDARAAAACYQELKTPELRRQVNGEDVLQIGDYLLESGANDEALSVFRRFVSERASDSRIARAHIGAGRALLNKPRCTTSAYHYFLGALDVASDPEEIERARGYLAHIQNLKSGQD